MQLTISKSVHLLYQCIDLVASLPLIFVGSPSEVISSEMKSSQRYCNVINMCKLFILFASLCHLSWSRLPHVELSYGKHFLLWKLRCNYKVHTKIYTKPKYFCPTNHHKKYRLYTQKKNHSLCNYTVQLGSCCKITTHSILFTALL